MSHDSCLGGEPDPWRPRANEADHGSSAAGLAPARTPRRRSQRGLCWPPGAVRARLAGLSEPRRTTSVLLGRGSTAATPLVVAGGGSTALESPSAAHGGPAALPVGRASDQSTTDAAPRETGGWGLGAALRGARRGLLGSAWRSPAALPSEGRRRGALGAAPLHGREPGFQSGSRARRGRSATAAARSDTAARRGAQTWRPQARRAGHTSPGGAAPWSSERTVWPSLALAAAPEDAQRGPVASWRGFLEGAWLPGAGWRRPTAARPRGGLGAVLGAWPRGGPGAWRDKGLGAAKADAWRRQRSTNSMAAAGLAPGGGGYAYGG